jgi:2-polyprenyl-6-methoxyphenol hydroxylase-like FAD-dependent oxidoreductase
MAGAAVSTKGRRAVVLGGGIAGLAAAGVVARHFEEVTLLERDRYPAEPCLPPAGWQPSVRPHTAHGAHVHILLAGGLVTLSRLVPALPGWLDEMGCAAGDLTYHTRVAFEGRWLPRAHSGIPIRTCTRADVEHVLRRDVEGRGNVRVLDGCEVVGFVGRDRVRGVEVSRDGAREELVADLAVDATGRGSSSDRWLSAAGLPAVPETVVDAGIVYTSAWFDPPAGIRDDWTVLATLPAIPHDARMAALVRYGEGRPMLCSVIDYGKPTAPRTHDDLVARLGALCVPELHRLLLASRPASDLAVYGNTRNRRRRYAALPWFPDGLVVLGDAACSLNPRYGQGMTVAALGADQLDRELSAARSLDGFSLRFQRSLDRLLTVPWQMALLEDRAWVSFFSGEARSLGQQIAVAGAQRVLRTAFTDIETYIRFMRVAHLLDGPTKMLAPRTLARIARGGAAGPSSQDAPGIHA